MSRLNLTKLNIMNPYLVADINQQGQQPGQPNPFSDSSPDSFIDVGGTLYFRADNGANGRELWKIDPITVNAVQLEIHAGSPGATIENVTIFNNTLYFTGTDSLNIPGLWKIGTNGNPERVALGVIGTGGIASNLVTFNGSLYFSGPQGQRSDIIYKIDSSGTVTALPFLPLQSDPLLNLGGLFNPPAVVGNTILFGASTLQVDGRNGQNGLWQLNASGTGLEAVQLYGASYPSPEQLTNANGVAYFVKGETIINGVSYFDRTLWKSDGTANGTVEVKIGSFRSDPNHPFGPQVRNLMDIGGTLYFVMEGDGLPRSIWRINGTGTPEMVKDLNETSGFPNLFPSNGALYFTANTGIGGVEQLWKVSGSGTPSLINRIGDPAREPHIASATTVNGDLYFISQYDASFRDNHLALWKIDGVTGASTLLSDVAGNTYAGSNLTRPGSQLTYSNGKLHFAANSFREGQELWAYNLTKQPTRNDFNGDGKSDILWRSDIGGVSLWQMDGATVSTTNLTSTPQLDPSWKAIGTGDFNGDGKTDVVWRNTNNAVAIWTMDGANVTSSSLTSIPSIDPSWKAAGTGDFNGDGKSDILWRNNDGSVALWQMNGATVVISKLTSTSLLDISWKAAGTGDFNGDGQSDILWRNDDGSVALWQMNGFNVVNSSLTSTPSLDGSWKINGTGDFNGDGKADILWRNTNTGAVDIWQMDGSTVTLSSLASTPSLDSSWTAAGTGDYNGDGKADILWRKDSGATVVWQMNGSTVLSSTLTSIQPDSTTWKIAAPIL
jgi:ELWxxDGT repeat protein